MRPEWGREKRRRGGTGSRAGTSRASAHHRRVADSEGALSSSGFRVSVGQEGQREPKRGAAGFGRRGAVCDEGLFRCLSGVTGLDSGSVDQGDVKVLETCSV